MNKKLKKRIAISQPTYLPWIGYFELILKADIFVFLDCAQYVKQCWHNRNRLKKDNGEYLWLVVPVEKHPLNTKIKDINISERQANWYKKHIQSITALLGGTAYINDFLPYLKKIYQKKQKNLCDLNIEIIQCIAEYLDISTKFIRASELNATGKKTEKLLDICQKLNANEYYSTCGAAAYLDEEKYLLENKGIKVVYQNWKHPVYEQKFKNFLSHMSIIDAIMNIGPEKTKNLLINEQ